MKTLSTLAGLIAACSALAQNTLLIGASGKHGETITIGDAVFELTTGPAVTAGRYTVDLSASAAAVATATLTLAGNAVADETVTIGAKVYTWKAAPTTVANEVKVGATAAESIDNLVAAIMGAAGAGTLYGSLTVASTQVTAVRSSATLIATAIIKGTAGNAFASTETMTNGSWGAATFAGGLDATATQTRDAIAASFNLNLPQSVTTVFTGGMIFVDSSGRGIKATTETMAGSGNAWVSTTTIGFDNGGAIPNLSTILQRAVTAAEATANRFVFALPATPTAYAVQVRTSAGVVKAWDGALTVIGNSIQLDNAGSVDLAENDVVTLTFAV